jgi:RHS repeat-associated protein
MHFAGSSPRGQFNYTRNDQGMVTSVVTEDGNFSLQYDLDAHLTNYSQPSLRLPASESTFAGETFSYDNIGNRTADQGATYTFDNTQQRLTETSRYTFQYDNDGNLTDRVDKVSGEYTKYEYSSQNQLLSIRVFPTIISSSPVKESYYFYDALGRRMKKQVVDHAATTDPLKTFTRQFIYDGDQILLEYDGSANLLARYTHSNLRTDDVLAVDVTPEGINSKIAPAAGSFTYLKDHLGSIQAVADANGNIVQKYDYSAFGMILGVKDSTNSDLPPESRVNTAFTFVGREYDSESGLYYNRARYYDPDTGRFLQGDPNPGQLQNPLTVVNRYAYAGNNPAMFIDPSGTFFGIDDLIYIAVASLVETVLYNNVHAGNFLVEFAEAFAVNSVLSFGGAFLGGSQLGSSTALADVGGAAWSGLVGGLTADAVSGAGLVAANNGGPGADVVTYGIDIIGLGYYGISGYLDGGLSGALSTIGNSVTGHGSGPSGIGFDLTVTIGTQTIGIPGSVQIGL